ncbi:MAG TPA: cytochrome c biogenesis protein CcdA, partial [Niabella sp.]|nr:cytochrome c biogenesis protein CcdA [Niabella sp.]
MKKLFFVFAILISTATLLAQDSTFVKFSTDQKRLNKDEVMLTITGRVLTPGVELYTLQKTPDDAVFTAISFDSASNKYLKGSIEEKGNIQAKTDPQLTLKVAFVADSIQWIQQLKIPETDTALVKVKVTYMFKSGEEFLSGEKELRTVVLPENKEGTSVSADKGGQTETGSREGKSESLLWIFLGAFGGGLLALLTPCVYSMIPVTVSFFTKRSTTKKEGIKNALIYSLSIIIIFTLIGFLITVIFGPAALNTLSTNWIANLVFFAIFVIFGISFLGAFEITLPSSWGNKADSKASTGSFWGIFFMALTLVIVSFSCTGPIIGNLLVLASKGSYWGPLLGMFAFSLALALPFALFAFFPSKLNVLGKAGGWLNAIKVTLGFLELALALKFLSNADLAKNWRILDREVFIVIWIVIFFLLGYYLLGKLKFRHDDNLPKNDFGIPHLTVTRLFFAIASFSMVVYLTPGLLGAPLKGLGAFLPPMGTQDFNADDIPKGFDLTTLGGKKGKQEGAHQEGEGLPEPVRYADVMKKNEPDVVVNNGMITYFDYHEALEISRKLKKPLMMDFTGINCVNCRKMETQVWSDPEVMEMLKNDFVIASLFVDVHDGVNLPIGNQFYSNELGKQVEDLGDYNTHLQVTKFG